MKRSAMVMAVLFISAITFSHEFWLQPIKFMLRVNEGTSIHVYVGEGFKGEKSDGTKYNVQQLRHFSLSGEENLIFNAIWKHQSSTQNSALWVITW